MEDRERLGRYVMAARKKMGYRERVDWAPVIGISSKTLGKIERGTYVGPGTLADIEVFFGWAPGSCQAVMRGEEPSLARPEVDADPTDDEIAAMDSREIARHSFEIEDRHGRAAAAEWLAHVLDVLDIRADAERNTPIGQSG